MNRPHNQSTFVRVLAAVAVAAGTLTACGGASAPAAPAAAGGPDQNELCEVASFRVQDVARACKPGQKVVFLPESWGNEQLPVIFAAVNCDLRYQVALTKGAVTCIYGPLKTAQAPAPAASAGK